VELEAVEREMHSRLGAVIDGYARRVYPAVLGQEKDEFVCSPLGVWLLLAACVPAADGDERVALEEALGCSSSEAFQLLQVFMASPPSALSAAIAVWVAVADATPRLADWVRTLPDVVESGFMPAKREADAWADRNTLGLIKEFPIKIDASTRIVLASALATKVSWPVPFEVVPASEHLGEASPWHGKVDRMLWDGTAASAMLVDTRAAGLVAVHQAVATEELTVISVSASPDIGRASVLAAAHEVASFARHGAPVNACSLFELPLGDGHSWQIEEHEARTFRPGQRVERIVGTSLPAWATRSQIDLQSSELFGSAPAFTTLGRLIDATDDDLCEALQAAIASFTRYGFEAAAITVFVRATSLRRAPDQTGIERTATLRFDHPYAALAITGRPVLPDESGQISQPPEPLAGLPLFTAWINQPHEPQDAPPTG
jgi:hypothetical protein